MNLRSTSADIPATTAKNALTFGGCRRTHVVTTWIGLLGGLIVDFDMIFLRK
jgi:hypothetical protein